MVRSFSDFDSILSSCSIGLKKYCKKILKTTTGRKRKSNKIEQTEELMMMWPTYQKQFICASILLSNKVC
jgi:hypothetical protein